MKSAKVILTTVLLLVTSVTAFAVPPAHRSGPSPALRSAAAFEDVKAGDKLALVCKQCDTVTVQTVASKEEAMEFCKVDAKIVCGSCKKSFKVVQHGPRGKSTETRIINDKGEDCMFVTKLPN
ncbi:MAG: hypothetical protein Q8M02_15085 [Candidatus Didemnitutus sp.]|nr:hypothetical protein [Candidatus Didemnitutus sp.]